MEDWKETPLSEITSLITKGTTPSMIGASFTESGIKYIKSESILDNSRILDSSKFAFISLKTHNRLKRSQIEENDLLFSMAGMFLGKTAIVTKNDIPANTNQAVAIIRIIPNKANFKFIYYYLNQKNIVKYINNLSGQSAQPNINLQQIGSLNINLPPLPTQQKIAQILSSLDDKIELNNKINANLEQQAQALFKSWFVDFEPFGGEMPAGWKEADIYSIANIIYGSPFASKLFNSEKNGKPIIRIRDLKDQHSDVYTPEERDDGYLIQPKDIVVGMDGEFRPYIWGSEPGWLNQRVCVFENKRPNGKAFLYFCIKPLLEVVEKTQVATTVIHIGKKDFDKFRIILPTVEILDKFDEITDPIIDQIVTNRLENIRLSTLRDTLLPKLMNGEIEV